MGHAGPMLWSRVDEEYDERPLQPRLWTADIQTNGAECAAKMLASLNYEPGARAVAWRKAQKEVQASRHRVATDKVDQAAAERNAQRLADRLWGTLGGEYDDRPLQPRLKTVNIETNGAECAAKTLATLNYEPGAKAVAWRKAQKANEGKTRAWRTAAEARMAERLWGTLGGDYDDRPLQPRLKTAFIETNGAECAAKMMAALNYEPGAKAVAWRAEQKVKQRNAPERRADVEERMAERLWGRLGGVYDDRPLQPRLKTAFIETDGAECAEKMLASLDYEPGMRAVEWRRAKATNTKTRATKPSTMRVDVSGTQDVRGSSVVSQVRASPTSPHGPMLSVLQQKEAEKAQRKAAKLEAMQKERAIMAAKSNATVWGGTGGDRPLNANANAYIPPNRRKNATQ